jgi:PmbA protein
MTPRPAHRKATKSRSGPKRTKAPARKQQRTATRKKAPTRPQPARRSAGEKTRTRRAGAPRTVRAAAKPAKSRSRGEELTGPDLLARCERGVELALARRADQAEVFWESGSSLGVELQNGRVASTSTDTGQGGSVRVVVGKRLGFAYCTEETDLARAIGQAIANARHGQLDYRLPDAGGSRGLGRWDDRIASLDADTVMSLANDLLAGARETAPKATFAGGGVGLDADSWAIASSEGAAAWDRATHVGASASLVLGDGERSVSSSESKTSHRLDLDAHWVGAEAGRTTMSLRGPQKVEQGGKADVLFRPEAALDLLVGPALGAAMGDDAKRGKSFWSGKLGEGVASLQLTIADDPLHPQAIGGASFDGEGLAARRLPIVEAGALRSFVYDSWDAQRHGEESTHSAVRDSFKSRPSAGHHHIVVEGSQPRRFDALVEGIADGFLVESVLGAHTANPTTGDFSEIGRAHV